MLSVNKIYAGYGSSKILKSVTFNIKKGDRYVVVGESGCGKTTLLKAIAGYIQIDKGSISLDSEKIKGPEERLVPGHEKIKLVNQDFELDTFHTVEENVRLKLLQFNNDYIEYRVETLLKITGLEKNRTQLASNLSGGQKQRLAIARALADEPEVLLLDEPFNQLDYFLRQKIENHIDEYLKKHKITLLMVSHNGEETMRWGEKVLFLDHGKIVRIDHPVNFYNYPVNKKQAGFFGVVNTIFFKKKYICFRPNAFSLIKNEVCSLEINVSAEKIIDKGWYFDHLVKYGKKTIHLYYPSPLTNINTIFIKPLF
ncbi:MAG: ABC transporter ATP-binding protein [Crocinitomicaceae bacterium]